MPAALETSQFANQQVAKLLDGLAGQVSQVIESPSPEPVHDLRVAIRRFTQALLAFPEYLPGREVKKVKRSLDDLMTLAGGVRDADIAIKKLMKSESPHSAPLREMRTRRKAAAGKLLAGARRWAARKSADHWRSALLPVQAPESCSFPVLDDHARQVLPQIARAFRKRGDRAADPNASATEVHHCRIQAKKLRYSLELFQPVYGPAAEAGIKRLRELQTLLGDVNDCRMVRVLLKDLDGTREIERRLKKSQKKKLRKFQKLWKAQFAPGSMRQWIQELRTPPRKPMARSMSIAPRTHAAKRA
jgi:CHAD domain-containing protein